jgi:hypothetical protein
MPVEDISRHLFDPRMRYATALMQQGRVSVDSDWNEMVRLEGEDRRRTIAETICAGGSPNDGFRVGSPPVAFAATVFPENPPGPAQQPVNSYNLSLGTGSFYLGGLRFLLDAATPPETFQRQADWLTLTLGAGNVPTIPSAADLAAGPRHDLVYLDGWQQSVTSFEDQELRERALGGPDTSVRVRRMRRVTILPDTEATNCAQADAALHEHLARPRPGDTGGPHAFDSTGTELLSKARLGVTFTGEGTDEDPCKPREVSGFLGAENQAIRVQLTAADRVIWSIDNAAPIYRVQVDPNDATNRRILFLTTPRDQAAMPLVGQAVELLPWGSLLANTEKAADASGFVSGISASYDPDDQSLTLATAVPQNMIDWLANLPAAVDNPHDLPEERRYFYLRVWTGGPPQDFTPGDAVELAGTGLEITFSDFGIPGDYWVIAARPNTPELVVPWRLLVDQPPSGPQHYYTPLALVRWQLDGAGQVQGTVHDCRERFRSLCRNNGCCMVIVGDGITSHGDFTSIQAAIDSLPATGGEVCILRGTYNEAVLIDGLSNVSLHGCGRDTRIVAPAGAAAAITIVDSNAIAIDDLAVVAPAARGIEITGDTTRISLRHLDLSVRDRAAVVAKLQRELLIEHCTMVADQLATDLAPGLAIGLEPLLYAAGDRMLIERNQLRAEGAEGSRRTSRGGLQIGGGSQTVEIRRNHIEGGNGNGITLGSIRFVPRDELDDPVFTAEIDGNTGDGSIVVGGFVFDPNNCVFVPGDPLDPGGPGGPDLVPVSEGDLDDIRIIDNRILTMGQSGIAVVRLFFQDDDPDLITIRHLDIIDNTIVQCMRLEVGPISAANIRRVAFGGIILAEVEICRIRGNIVEGVGSTHRDSICGIFALSAEGIAIEGNRIRRNGRVAVEGQPLKLGHKGGIVIRLALAPTEPLSFGLFGEARTVHRQDGVPAAYIHGNVVVAREGRALFLMGIGPMVVTDNQFTAHGSDFLALLDVLIASIVGDIQLAPGGTLGGASQLPPGVSTLDLLLDALGGTAIFIFNLGWSNEIYFQMLGLVGITQNAFVQNAQDDARLFIGGNVLFNDNQVVYDALDPVISLSLCAVLLFSFDSITMGDNQVDCDLAFDFVVVNTLALALSTQVTGNRFKEGIFNCFLSAITVGILLNATGLNVGTHCIVDVGLIKPRALPASANIDLHLNIALVDPNGDNEECGRFGAALPRLTRGWGNKAVDAPQLVAIG